MVNPTSESVHVAANSTTGNTVLQMNDDSSSSRMTKLDIEHNDDTLNSNNENDPDIDNNDDTDMDDLPPLSTYLAGWKFWFQFAIWPFVFLMLNGVIVSTLVTFDEYEFQYGKRRHSHMYYDISINENRNGRIPYEMLKYNRMIIAVLLLIDTFIIYRAILFLDKKVRELDMIGDVNHDESNAFSAPSPSHGLKPNVHAQVSRKLDAVLGRNPQSRISILVSILWLLFVGCGTVGLVSVSDLLFAISPKGKQVCMGKASSTSSSNHNNNNDDKVPNDGNYNNTKPIANIPDELQEWARTRHDMFSYTSTLVHLTNGVTFFTAADPSENRTRNDRSIEYMYGGPKIQLVSIGIGGNITFHKNAINPNTFTSLSGENLLNSTGFCCLYTPVADRQNSRSIDTDDGMMYQAPDMSIRNPLQIYLTNCKNGHEHGMTCFRTHLPWSI
jgi:hypothetical protein